MPKHNNRAAISNRLARRASNQNDIKRSDLLGKILEESSSIPLNDGTNQPTARQALDNHSRLLELIDELRQVESACNPELPCRNDQSWAEFFRWIDAELITETKVKLSERMAVSDQSPSCGASLAGEQEYALITKVPLNEGESIFGVHRRVMLSTETATKDSDLFEFIKRDSIASAMQNVVLVLHLLNEYSKGEKSYWWPYLAIMPSKTLPILTMNEGNLKCLLASSHIFEALKMIRAIARQYSYFFKRLQATNLPLSKDFTFEYYSWGVSIVCSRQNEIPPLDRSACSSPVVHALIPILDMCNHDRLSNQAIFEDNQSRLVAPKKLNINDEITINYGCRSSGDFYIHNGFVPEEVPYDVVPLNIVLNKKASSYEAKNKLLKTLNMPSFGRFRLTHNNFENRHKRDPHLTMFLIVYFLTEKELELIMSSENPVGIADEIYEYVQYSHCATNNSTANNDRQEVDSYINTKENRSEISAMKERLCTCVKEYLSKRATIGIALIDRTLNDIELLDTNTSMMLRHEKSLYESYLINAK